MVNFGKKGLIFKNVVCNKSYKFEGLLRNMKKNI